MRTWITVFACVFALARVARADGDDARSHYEKGLSAYALEHYGEAATEYEKAFSLKADPALLYNAAQAHRLAGNTERALRLYQSYLRIFGKKATATNKADVTRHIHALEAALESQRAAQSNPPTDVAEPAAVEKPANEPVTTRPAPTPATTHASAPLQLTAKPVERERPIYKKAWFWGVVVGAVAVVGLGVGLGVGLSGGSKNPSPSFGTTTIQ